MGFPPPLRPLVEGVGVTMGRVQEEEAAIGTPTSSGRTLLKERSPLPSAPKLGATEVLWSTAEPMGTEEAGTDTDTEIKKKVGTKTCQLVIVST